MEKNSKVRINDIQITLNGKKIILRSSTTTSYHVGLPRSDSKFWDILILFCGNPLEPPNAYGIKKIKHIMNLHVNTIQYALKKLHHGGFIRLVAEGVGTKCSEKLYLITDAGYRLHDSYIQHLDR